MAEVFEPFHERRQPIAVGAGEVDDLASGSDKGECRVKDRSLKGVVLRGTHV
jgi:hypothetical protein